jgi:hypothetical protein
VNLGTGVVSFGEEAFRNCARLPSIAIPASVTSIGSWAFRECPRLVDIQVDAGNPAYCSREGVLFNKNVTKLICHPIGKADRAYAVPDGTTTINDYAFSFCTNLEGVTLPFSVTNIGQLAFYGCSNLISFTVGPGLASIGYRAFCYCPKLTSVRLEGHAPGIGLDVFTNSSHAVVYYRYGTSGWAGTFAGRPTSIWPEFLSAGVGPDGFAFDAVASSNHDVVVEMCADLLSGNWTAVSTNSMTGVPVEITIPDWADHLMRFYRIVLK